MLKDKKGFSMISFILMFVLVFGLMAIGLNNLLRVATERAIIHNAAAQSAAEIQWTILESQDSKSENELDNKHILPNIINFDSNKAVQIVEDTFAKYNYEIDNVSVYMDDYNFTIEGDVPLKTHDTTANNQMQAHKTNYVHVKYTDRIFKNHGKE